jgi:ubiquinone/menaquinone biosynthesis C-methylase UbiE
MPPRKARIIGTTLSMLIAYAPWLWPLLRRPTRRFWNRMAPQWHGRASPDRAVALEAGARAVPGAPARILEVGCGAGDGTAALVRVFPDARITGVDLCERMVATAKATNPGPEYVVGDAAALPFPDATFDLVAQLNVPFFPSELSRVVKPGGHILVASTLGPITPYYTPHSFLRRKLTEAASGKVGRGDWFIGRPS